MITDDQMISIARGVVSSPVGVPSFIVLTASAYLAADEGAGKMLVEKAWEPMIHRFEKLRVLLDLINNANNYERKVQKHLEKYPLK